MTVGSEVADVPAPETGRTRRRVLIAACVAGAIAVVVWIGVRPRRGPPMPASVWEVPELITTTAAGRTHINKAIPTPATNPGAAPIPELRAIWKLNGSAPADIMVLQDLSLVERVRLLLGQRVGGRAAPGAFIASDETRDVAGTTWRRYDWRPDWKWE